MEVKTTGRGFGTIDFKDQYGKECYLRESSLTTDTCIWLGISNPRLTVFEDENLGKYLQTDLPKNWRVDSLMHLTQDQVKELLPFLQKFAETGFLN